MDDLEDIRSQPFRDRSNTWPRYVDQGSAESPPPVVPDTIDEEDQPKSRPLHRTRPRRNIWGNKSYAELITEAIQSSDQQRMTLAQIYEWMVKNVDYFSDKQGDTSSAGWKNSIRHNLSLHECFMKQPNETPGKSNWWVLNPNARPTKLPRRRTTVPQRQASTVNHDDKSQSQSEYSPPFVPVDVDQQPLYEPFRRRAKSDCSSYKRPLPFSSDGYVPNYCGTSSTLELEKYEADQVLDSLVTAMKYKRREVECTEAVEPVRKYSGNTPNVASFGRNRGENLVSSLVEAIRLDGDNKYLEAVEPVSGSPPPPLCRNLNPISIPSAFLPVEPEYAEACFKFEGELHPDKLGPEAATRQNVYSSSYDNRYEALNNRLNYYVIKAGEGSLLFQNVPLQRNEQTTYVSRNQETCIGKIEKYGVPEDSTSYSNFSVNGFPSNQVRQHQDSSGRVRSKSFGGKPTYFSTTRRLIGNSQVEDSYMTSPLDNFDWGVEQFFQDGKNNDASLQSMEPFPVLDDIHSSTILSLQQII